MVSLKMHTDRIRKGMMISRDVYSNNGILLVKSETVVTSEVLELLARYFIEYVYISFETREESFVTNPIEQRRAEIMESLEVAEQVITNNLKAIMYQDEEIDVPLLLDTMNAVLKKVTNDGSLYDMLFCMKESKEGLYRHSINVSLLGQVLAKWLNFTDEEVECVSVAGLLHDIGILGLTDIEPDEAFFMDMWKNKNHRYEKHVINGYNKIKNKNIDYRIKQAVLTHHEKIDKSGFPLQMGADNINKISRVIAIADAYDILTMQEAKDEDMSPLKVMKYLEELSYSKLDPNMFMVFFDKITQSYIQENVMLNNGKVGRIITINRFNLLRPLLEVDGAFVDLTKHPEISIVKFVG